MDARSDHALIAARRAADVPLARDEAPPHALAALLAECHAQIVLNAALLAESDDPEAVHQLRIGLRRLRSVADIFRPYAENRRLLALAEDAKRLGQEVAHLRDLDVARADLLAPAQALAPDEPGFALLDLALRRRATLRRRAVRRMLAEVPAQAFLQRLGAAHDIPLTAKPRRMKKLAPQALDRAWKRVTRRAHGIETLEAPERHALRKALKRLRYTAEFLGPLYAAQEQKTFLKSLRRMQDLFGELNDLAMAEALLTGEAAPYRTSPEVQRAVGLILGARRYGAEEDWRHARELWTALKDLPKFWR